MFTSRMPGNSLGCCPRFRSPVSVCDGKVFKTSKNLDLMSSCKVNLIGALVSRSPQRREIAAYSTVFDVTPSAAACLCICGTDGGNGGAGRNNNNNNNNKTKYGHSGDDDNSGREPDFGFGKELWMRCSRHALLGALALLTASATFSPPSYAAPGSLFDSCNNIETSIQTPPLSSSAPTGGGDFFLERSSSLKHRFSTEGGRSGGSSASASTSSSPNRPLPRSKVMHVACKGSTLVVPLTGAGGDKVPYAQSGRVSLPWQRKRVVEAPIQLSEREARMILSSRQNRVRDSLLVHAWDDTSSSAACPPRVSYCMLYFCYTLFCGAFQCFVVGFKMGALLCDRSFEALGGGGPRSGGW
ncbi:hypothetical protein VOLCADRAFT_93974 [Volvox carteri f. nagariensis]|uniref:Uncharacterized protein n=1 Tax=Volvox carteri f. nagariensis TaxID=3068 RepID=D8U3K5_VOLCA|nr:uncharacterized protein VOLCADRAFT_93974 [Volvox carteri f. nagariensis]EFJ45623.1 hypothetical protein VOLCADRAFT_93974 [Volvox carteri f. nagariensis]|eukprot:XP_002953313.1 hypothetical protein VOLCADRAFT_93974 [Volvox carteri f. nagariensis]